MKRLCVVDDCPRYAEVGGRCREHARSQRKGNRSANNSFYASKPWRMTLRRYLRDHPICEECGDRLADSVHHVQPLEQGGAPRDPANLMGMCRPCHSGAHGGG